MFLGIESGIFYLVILLQLLNESMYGVIYFDTYIFFRTPNVISYTYLETFAHTIFEKKTLMITFQDKYLQLFCIAYFLLRIFEKHYGEKADWPRGDERSTDLILSSHSAAKKIGTAKFEHQRRFILA